MSEIKLKIRIYGDPCLRQKSQPVKEVSPPLRLLLKTMLKTMYEEDGVGLAAPQVGINERFFVADMGEGPHVYINPQVLSQSGGLEVGEEGCLSLPGLAMDIPRQKKIEVVYVDEENQEIRQTLEDMKARIFLHEFDHLEGKLLIDYADEKDKPELIKKIQPKQS